MPLLIKYMNNNNKRSIKDLDLAFIDTETTGTDFNHELIEIAVIRASSYDFTVLDEWEAKIKPRNIESAEEAALKINHYNDKDWEKAVDLETALKTFLEKTENAVLVGHNLTFDWTYIHKSLAEFNLKPTFHFKSLDTISLAWQKLRHDSGIRSFSVKELANYFNIKQDKPHSALDDARTAYKIFLKLNEL